MDRAVADGHDVVFGAGNCGEFCPSSRCGPGVQGPGNSIFGANSHPKVLTVGAVNPDKMWLGYSSQGPGQSNLDTNKPDLCAPSEFVENTDAGTANTGTSVSCALAAGVIACLRSRGGPASVPPDELKRILIQTTSDGQGWNGMTGHGILNAKKAYDALVQLRSK
jgi:subtilisin family serine protease